MSAVVVGAPARGADAGASGGAGATGGTTDGMGFSAEVLPDRATGWNLVVLRYRDQAKAGQAIEVRIAPEAGANLYSWKVDGVELLTQAKRLADVAEQRTGTPLMFPTVNRVRDARMEFEGQKFSFEPNNGKNFIHGLARRRPFAVGPTGAKPGQAATAEVFLDWDEKQPEFARFPLKHRLTLSYTLRKSSLSIGYRVDNRDRARLPFAFGLHPYFHIPGQRAEVTVSAPVEKRMEAIEYLPTGKLIPVAGTPYDLRRGKPLSELALDDAYLGMVPGKAAVFATSAAAPRIHLGGSAEFTHLVVYTPPDKPFFCIENQTSSTDAHNLHAQGKKKAAHLLVVAPGKKATGEVIWTVRRRR